jgi:hypothetical protein
MFCFFVREPVWIQAFLQRIDELFNINPHNTASCLGCRKHLSSLLPHSPSICKSNLSSAAMTIADSDGSDAIWPEPHACSRFPLALRLVHPRKVCLRMANRPLCLALRSGVVLWAIAASSVALVAKPRSCVSPNEAAGLPKKDVCLAAHVYDVVQLPDGTRFLDVCAPATPDDRCRFIVVSLRDDRAEVGDLGSYRDKDVQIRGTVEPMHGRSGIVLSHARQFSGGPPRFRPNPRLLHGFSGDRDKPPIADPNLRPQGSHRAFMNSRDQEPLPSK